MGRKIMGVCYSALLTRYDAIRFFHLVEGCDISKALFMVRNFLNAVKRMNPVMKKVHVTAELLSWVENNFVGENSMPDSQIWPSLMIDFLFCLRISEMDGLRENDRVFPSLQMAVARLPFV